jgi:HEPN domain-containing protein
VRNPSDSLYPGDWKKIAGKDLERVSRNLRDNDLEAAAFFLQQSLEKYIKAFLLEHGWKLEKIHVLPNLLDEAVNYLPELEKFRDLCERVGDYYFVQRYPQVVPLGLEQEDLQKDLKQAEQFVNAMFPEKRGH